MADTALITGLLDANTKQLLQILLCSFAVTVLRMIVSGLSRNE